MNEKQTHILGCKLDLFTREEVFYLLQKWLGGSQLKHVVTLNPEICLCAQREEGYTKTLNRADMTIPDGFGLSIAARILGTAVRERVTGRDLLDMLCRLASERGQSIYLLGGEMGIAAKAAEQLRKQYPTLRIAGASEGMSKEQFRVKNTEVCQAITAAKADILLVAFGAPKQEQFIASNRHQLRGVKIAVGVGGLFDYLAGKVPQPPRWVSKIGMEWVFRLVTQPWRWKRIWQATVVFLYDALVWRVRMSFIFRKNAVGMIVNRNHTHVLLVSPWWSETVRWQFPQGGREKGEDAQTAVIREMKEEIGTDKFKILAYRPAAHRYLWPAWYRRVKGYRGQIQDLFILEFVGTDKDINLGEHDELASWTWARLDHALSELAPARKEIGRIGLDLFYELVSVDKDRSGT